MFNGGTENGRYQHDAHCRGILTGHLGRVLVRRGGAGRELRDVQDGEVRQRVAGTDGDTGMAGAFIFVLSALMLPSVTGSTSHPTGTGIAVVLFGPTVTAVLSTILLVYHALLLAHGGITTLGANAVSMGVVGPAIGWIGYTITRRYTGIAAATLLDLLIFPFLAPGIGEWGGTDHLPHMPQRTLSDSSQRAVPIPRGPADGYRQSEPQPGTHP